MSGSINKVLLLGNLGFDPEVRHSNDGAKIVTLSIATSESWKDKVTGERKEKTEWHRVVIFNEKLAEIAEKYLTKGARAFVEGQLQTRKWTDKDGNEKYTTEVILSKFKGELTLMGSKNDGSSSTTQSLSHSDDTSYVPRRLDSGKGLTNNLDDDIPF